MKPRRYKKKNIQIRKRKNFQKKLLIKRAIDNLQNLNLLEFYFNCIELGVDNPFDTMVDYLNECVREYIRRGM